MTVLVQLLVKRCHVRPYSMVTEQVWVYIRVWCVAFACVCSVCRQIPHRLSRFKCRSRANSCLTGAPSSHGRQRWRQLRWARYEHVPHQSCERKTNTVGSDKNFYKCDDGERAFCRLEYHFKTYSTLDFNICNVITPMNSAHSNHLCEFCATLQFCTITATSLQIWPTLCTGPQSFTQELLLTTC